MIGIFCELNRFSHASTSYTTLSDVHLRWVALKFIYYENDNYMHQI